MTLVGDVLRVAALEDHVRELTDQAHRADGDEAAELLRDALAARARQVAVMQGRT